MFKIFRYQFSNISRSILQPMLVSCKHYRGKTDFIQNHIGCCYFQLNLKRPSDILKEYHCSNDFIRMMSVKSSQKSVIGQEDETINNTPKKFVEYESILHHKVFEDSDIYSSTIFKMDKNFTEKYRLSDEEFKNLLNSKDWETKSPYHVASAFVSCGIYSASNLNLTMDDELFNNVINAFVNKCCKFSDEQLVDCLIAIQIWPLSVNVKANNYLKVWKTLDTVCLERYLDWSIDKILFMMDLWYHIRLVRLSMFAYKGLNKMSRKCNDLTRAQMIQIMFYMSCARKIHPHVSMREYEYYLQKHITHLTIEEIGIFTLAFFKTKTVILNEKLLLYSMQRVVEEMDTINEATLAAIAKALRFSQKPEICFTVNDLVEKITEQKMDSLKLITCIHIASISSRLQFFNAQLLNKLAEKLCANLPDARLKDMERVVFLLSLFNYIPPTTPDILDMVEQQLDLPHHVVAANDFPVIYVSLLYFLTLLKRFPEKHIKYVLSEEFLSKHFENKFTTAVQVLQIDYNRVLEGPQGSEHLLTSNMSEYLARKNSIFTPDQWHGKLANFDQMMLEVMNTTHEVLGGKEFSLVTYTLPHFPRADILFRLGSDGKPIPIPEELRSWKPFEDVLLPKGDGWRCVVVASRNMYMFNVPKLVGEANAKLRQLRLLGYTPIVIPFHYWMAEKNKVDYLKLKYFSNPG